jgi:hypothetical protein
MIKRILLCVFCASVMNAQTLAPQVSSFLVTMSFTSSPNPVSAIQWTVNLPLGATVAWGTSGAAGPPPSKTLHCNPSGVTCVFAGLNQTSIPSGTIAIGTVTLPASVSNIAVSVSSVQGVSGSGSAVGLVP